MTTTPAQAPPTPRKISRRPTGGDAVFEHTFRSVGASVLIITGGIGVFLALQSIPTLKHYGPSFFSVHEGWNFDTDRVSVASLLVGTVEVALIAISIAFPLALATALYISEYAPPRLQATLISAIDLMAAVPSIVFGLWARDLVQPHASNVAMFVDRHVGPFAVHGNELTFLVDLMLTSAAIWVVVRWAAQIKSRWANIPLYISLAAAVALLPVCFTVNADPNAANLAPQQSSFQKSAFIAGIAVAMMVLPMACAIMRQVFSQTPPGEKEAALALGSTKWGMIRAVVLPFGKGGIIGGTMLSLGRALGETIAVLLIINQVFQIKPHVLETGTATVSSTIAAQFGEATGIQLKALLTAGFVLFVITLIVNTLAAIVVNRSRSGKRDVVTALLARAEQFDESTPRTTLPTRRADEDRPVPRTSLGVLPLEYRFLAWGARFAAVGLAWVIVERLLPIDGLGWFVVVAGLCNVVLLAVGTLVIDSPVAMADRVAEWVFSTAAVIVFGTLLTILAFVFIRGWAALHHWNFFTQTMHTTLPDAPYDQGGVLQSIVGTLIELGIAIAITLPLGVATAVYVNEVGGRFARLIRTVVEAMTALPSIVAGLFIYSVWIILLGEPRSGFAGALAISVMMLPIIARASEVVLRVVPGSLREASFGLGASRWRTVWHVVLPTARPGLATALILAVARGIGETSPVLIASGYATFLVTHPMRGVMSSLPLSVFNSVIAPEPQAVVRGYATAAVLLILVLVLFVIARLLARPPSSKPPLRRRIRRTLLPARRTAPMAPTAVPSMTEEPT